MISESSGTKVLLIMHKLIFLQFLSTFCGRVSYFILLKSSYDFRVLPYESIINYVQIKASPVSVHVLWLHFSMHSSHFQVLWTIIFRLPQFCTVKVILRFSQQWALLRDHLPKRQLRGLLGVRVCSLGIAISCVSNN